MHGVYTLDRLIGTRGQRGCSNNVEEFSKTTMLPMVLLTKTVALTKVSYSVGKP